MTNSIAYPCQLPPYLQPGDLVIAIAPSGALKEFTALERGLEIWRSRGYRVELGSNWNAKYGYLAGEDRQRRQALVAAWHNPECKAIVAVRGGYGGARLLEDWTWQPKTETIPYGCSASTRRQKLAPSASVAPASAASSQPKWTIGFSDITSLLWSLARENIASLHAPVLTTLAVEPQWSIERMFSYLEGGAIAPLQGQGWSDGQARGILLPANLTVATHLLKTPIQPSLEGVILAFEDVTEYPYRLDRLLTQWRMMGAFNYIKGIALGRFSRCEPYPGSKSWTVTEVLRDRLGDLGIPIVAELPFGHDGANAALPVGRSVQLNGKTGILSWD